MISRRNFITLLGASSYFACANKLQSSDNQPTKRGDIVLTTWNNVKANDTAWTTLQSKDPVTAIEKGINVVEANPDDSSVGFGGLPDRDGNVTLDACIMDHLGNAGSVTYLKNFMHPISVARKVMEETPHVMLSGEGAALFAENQGFKQQNLLTTDSEERWREWLKKGVYKPVINIENHDTIGMLIRSDNGLISGGCSTSGLAFKMAGRVGDSPIIGSGLFVDNEIGACVATGLGEEVMKNVSSFLVVELMRNGKSPQEACEEAIGRIVAKTNYKDFQVGLIALNKQGEIGAFSIHKGFNYTYTIDTQTTVNQAKSYI